MSQYSFIILLSEINNFHSNLQVNGAWSLPNVVCDFYIAMDVICSTSSIFNLVAISIDRWVHKNTLSVNVANVVSCQDGKIDKSKERELFFKFSMHF